LISVPTVGSVTGYAAKQAYIYDALNRLATAQENFGNNWKQNFGYDRFGNRKLISGTTLPVMLTPANNPTINPDNNRIDRTASGQIQVLYDAAGNLTQDSDGRTYQYDAENELVSYQGGATSDRGANYSYDGNGQRVKKVVGGDSLITTVFVYDIQGQLVAEYANSAPGGGGTSYITADILGSPRVITGANQEVKGRHDYLPFGGEIFSGTGNRSPEQKFGADFLRKKFTGYERDVETQLDYAQARYYSSAQGRFTRPDPYNIISVMEAGRNQKERSNILNTYLSEPRNWNRYAYCINNPMSLTDPSGLMWLTKDSKEYIWIDDDQYEKNKDAYEGYTAVNGAVTTYQGGANCPQCKGLVKGDLVQLNENGKITKLDPNDALQIAVDYTSYSIGILYFNVGGIQDSQNQLFVTFGVGKSWSNYSASVTHGNGPVQEGIYFQWGAANGVAGNQSINVFHPGDGVQSEIGYGTPNMYSAGFQVVIGPLKGQTEWDKTHHIESGSPHRVLSGGGRCPY
jgi:RHS repeat-associated protein